MGVRRPYGDQIASECKIGSPNNSRPPLARWCLSDDIGDDIGNTESDGGFDGSIQGNQPGTDAVIVEVRRNESGIRRRQPKIM